METEVIQEPNKGNALALMMERQMSLLKFYSVMESMPEYPVSLSKKENQRFLKDLGRRFIEELAEAYDALSQTLKCAETNNQGSALAHLKEYNNELGDAWHFLVEFMIFIGWDSSTINNCAKEYYGNGVINVADNADPLKTLEFIATHENVQANTIFNGAAVDNYRIIPFIDSTTERYVPYLGGRLIGIRTFEIHDKFLWLITFHINKCLNILNNRDHHQMDEKKANEMVFHAAFFEFLVIFMRYMNFIGKPLRSIYFSYCLMNIKNHERINQSY